VSVGYSIGVCVAGSRSAQFPGPDKLHFLSSRHTLSILSKDLCNTLRMGTIYRMPSFVAIGEEMSEKFEVIEGGDRSGCSVSMRLPGRCSKSS